MKVHFFYGYLMMCISKIQCRSCIAFISHDSCTIFHLFCSILQLLYLLPILFHLLPLCGTHYLSGLIAPNRGKENSSLSDACTVLISTITLLGNSQLKKCLFFVHKTAVPVLLRAYMVCSRSRGQRWIPSRGVIRFTTFSIC